MGKNRWLKTYINSDVGSESNTEENMIDACKRWALLRKADAAVAFPTPTTVLTRTSTMHLVGVSGTYRFHGALSDPLRVRRLKYVAQPL